jgi:hypothetical protein
MDGELVTRADGELELEAGIEPVRDGVADLDADTLLETVAVAVLAAVWDVLVVGHTGLGDALAVLVADTVTSGDVAGRA